MTAEQRRLVHVVDDDDAVRRAATFLLRTAGYRVAPYESGVALLDQTDALEPGCILLDVRMPGMDGLAVQQALLEKGVTLPIVLMTGHGDDAVAVRALDAGAVRFIEKPFEKAALLAALEEAFARIGNAERLSLNATAGADSRDQRIAPPNQPILASTPDCPPPRGSKVRH